MDHGRKIRKRVKPKRTIPLFNKYGPRIIYTNKVCVSRQNMRYVLLMEQDFTAAGHFGIQIPLHALPLLVRIKSIGIKNNTSKDICLSSRKNYTVGKRITIVCFSNIYNLHGLPDIIFSDRNP